jgi:hypothetical protein
MPSPSAHSIASAFREVEVKANRYWLKEAAKSTSQSSAEFELIPPHRLVAYRTKDFAKKDKSHACERMFLRPVNRTKCFDVKHFGT